MWTAAFSLAHTPLTRYGYYTRVSVCTAVQGVPTTAKSSRTTIKPIREYVQRLQAGEDLGESAGDMVSTLVDGLAGGEVPSALAGGVLALLPPERVSSVALSSIASMLRGRMRTAKLDGDLLDIVGTGGDGLNTVNISTAAAIVAAGAGCRVAKSGNRSASSKSGSADVLEALGVSLGDGDDELLQRCLEDASIAFLFARNHHPALGAVAAARKEYGCRTVFNVLGPLVHPVPAQRVVLGVYSPALVAPIANALAQLGTQRAMVVHCAGLDELSPVSDALVAHVRDGRVVGDVKSLNMNVAGITSCSLADLVGGDATQNAAIIKDVLKGKPGPVADAILLNAGAGCVVYGLDETLEDGVRRARRAIESGAAAETLKRWAEASTQQ